MCGKPKERRSTKKDFKSTVRLSGKRLSVRVARIINDTHVADKHPRSKYDISLKQITFSGTGLNDEESMKDYLKKKGIIYKKHFVLHSKLKFQTVNSALICQVCGAESINGTCFVCIGQLNSCQSTPLLEIQNECLYESFDEPQDQILNSVPREEKRSPVNVSLTFQSLNNEPDIASAQDAVQEVLPTQDVLGQSSTIGISGSNTIHIEQPPKLNTYEGKQTQQSFGSADANTGSINDTQQNRSSAVNQEPVNINMSGSNDTVTVDETNANKKEKLIRVHRLKLRLDRIEAFKEIRPYGKITFEVIDAREEREEGTGIGVERDTYAMFWKEVSDILFIGCSERVPFIRHDLYIEEWVAIRNYFPTRISRSFTIYCLFEDVPSYTILRSFSELLSKTERDVVNAALKRSPHNI